MTQQQLADLMARIMGDRDGMRYTVRYKTKGEPSNEGADCVRGIAENMHGIPRTGA